MAVSTAAGLAAVLLAAGGVVFASTAPDGIEQLARQTGISARARTLISTPFKDYEASWLGAGWPAQAAYVVFGQALLEGKYIALNEDEYIFCVGDISGHGSALSFGAMPR